MANSSSELMQLNYPQAGTSVLVMALLSMTGHFASAFLLYIILRYDTFINRQTSLLTRTYNIKEWVLLLGCPMMAFENIIILTGVTFHPYICTGYILQNFIFEHLEGLATAMEAVVHYLFVVKSSRFLIIKDDILCAIFWRSAIAISISSTGRHFMGLKQMPRAYHFCTGTVPADHGPLESKCDEDNIQY